MNARAQRARIRVAGAIVTASLAAGCETITPLQTASTVDPGMWRVGAQLSASPYCTVTLDPTGNCYIVPGNLPIPQLKLAARAGVFPRVDAGLSIQGSGTVPVAPHPPPSYLRMGALLDAKVEVWSASTESGRHLVAAAAGVGSSLERWSTPSAPLALPDLELVVPIFYGYQTPELELVASPRFMERFTFIDITGDGRREVLEQPWLGLALRAITRGPQRWAFGLDYSAPTWGLHQGAWTISVGFMLDLGRAR
ncbi:MAG TPA: hypothetical protein VE549_16325 [Myxococcaceae bacterium]|nr:hypothetical protein [Myxococcaceae bacterium]